MRQSPPLAVAYRSFLSQLRLGERRIHRAVANLGPMPDPAALRQELSTAIASSSLTAEQENRDARSQELAQVQYLMAWTADRRLGHKVDWSGAASFRASPLVVDFPAPEKVDPDPVVQARTVDASNADSGLPGVLLLVLAVAPPQRPADSGEDWLDDLRSHLFELQTGHSLPGGDDMGDEVLFPDAYRRASQPPTSTLLPAVRRWALAAVVLGVSLLLLGSWLWVLATGPVRDSVGQVLGAGS